MTTAPPPPWDWLGEPLAVDFANTVRRRGDAYEELLASPVDVAAWAAYEHGLGRVPPVAPRALTARLDAVRAVRDDVFAVLRAVASGTAIPGDAAGRLNARLRRDPVVGQLGERPGNTESHVVSRCGAVDELLARVTAATVALAGRPDGDLGLCDAPSCGQFFLRARPNQRWCGPACGNRARVARHAHHRPGSHSAP